MCFPDRVSRRYNRGMNRRTIHRTFDLVIGIPFLLLGACTIGFDLLTWIGAARNLNPNFRPITTFPAGTIIGIPLFWIGHQLVFRTPWLLLVHRLLAVFPG